jgi:tripartite-type tricarboxylate transporter receptor subunit TctC
MTGPFLKLSRALLAATLVALPLASPSFAQSPEEFYKGKTVRIMHVTGPGGTMDLYVLMVIKHIQKHLPQGTTVVLEHRPGAGGIVGANHLYSAAPKDGTYIGMPTPSVVLLTFGRPEQARYKPEELIPLGRLIDVTRVFVARADSGIKSLKDATTIEATHSTMPPGSSPHLVAWAANEVIGTRFKVVPGYSGGGPMFVAMEQNEVQSTTAEPGNLLANKWDQVKDGKVNVLAQASNEPTKGLENVPLWTDFAPKDHPLRGVIDAVSGSAALGLSLFFPPGVPAERVAYMRAVIEKTVNDPELVKEARERNIPLDWRPPQWLADHIKASLNQPETVRKWFATLVEKK